MKPNRYGGGPPRCWSASIRQDGYVDPEPPADPKPTVPAPTVPAPTVPAPAAKTRGERSPRDMALSLLVLLLPIAVLIGFYRFFLDGDEPIAVDTTAAVAAAPPAKAV